MCACDSFDPCQNAAESGKEHPVVMQNMCLGTEMTLVFFLTQTAAQAVLKVTSVTTTAVKVQGSALALISTSRRAPLKHLTAAHA